MIFSANYWHFSTFYVCTKITKNNLCLINPSKRPMSAKMSIGDSYFWGLIDQ